MDTNVNQPPRNSNSGKTIWMVLAILLFIVCGVLTWQLVTTKSEVKVLTYEKQGLSDEKLQLIGQLEGLQKKYDQLSEDNTNLNEMFEKEKQNVQKLMDQIRTASGSIDKYKKKVALMETREKEYERQIEELKAANKELIAENFNIKTSLDSAVTQNKSLTAENAGLTDKVNKGSVLTAYDIVASGIKISSKKEVPTLKAKRAEKVRVCFTIGKNAIASAGDKDIYIRIADPAGKILCKGTGDDYSFAFQDKKIQYSIKERVTYQNDMLERCMYWEKSGDFAKGNYIVDIFADGANIGTSTFILE